MSACAWCLGPMPEASRSGRARRADSLTCSTPCRQARHRFAVAPGGTTHDRPRRWGYADPPYPGLARRYYGSAETNHAVLVGTLTREHPDGWALSTSSSPGLQHVLPLCPPGVRVCAFVRGARATLAYRPRQAWEALIVYGGRPQRIAPSTPSDDVVDVRGRQSTHPGALVGMKPAAFCGWLFSQLGAARGDELVDYFPGSGAVQRAWALFQGDELAWVDRASRRVEQLDASRRARGDASRSAELDTSARGTRRVVQVLGDASRSTSTDVSRPCRGDA